MFKVPERHRIHTGTYGSDRTYGNNGAFMVPHPKIGGVYLLCIASDGEGWEHVSVTLQAGNGRRTSAGKIVKITVENRPPNWGEMCYVKDMFWGAQDAVMQLHPPKSDYVNMHPSCLHLWRPTTTDIPLPPSIMVGFK